MPPEHPPIILPPSDPWLDLTAVKCAECRKPLAFANASSPTRTMKLVCSPECARAFFDESKPELDDVCCVQCTNSVASALSISPSRLLKLTCSFACAATYYQTNMVRCQEP